jgi:hypothetical protein
MDERLIVVAIGTRARAALALSAGRVEALSAFPSSPYLRAAGELIWVSHRPPAMHPRAVHVGRPLQGAGAVRFGALPAPDTQSCALPTPNRAALAAARRTCARLLATVDAIGAPQGLGMLLGGRLPPFPLDAAVPHVRAFARALRTEDPDAARAAAHPLLGLGPGLTPSGDDFVGAALCARLFRVRAEGGPPTWHAAAGRLVAAARERTNEVSAALFGDLVAGEAYAPLAALLRALAAGNLAEALAAARSLAVIGHSSGWDMLAGCVVGLTGRLEEKGAEDGAGHFAVEVR